MMKNIAGTVPFSRLFLFSQSHCDLFGGNGEFTEPLAGCPVDGMGNRGAGGVDHDLTDGLGAEGAGGLIAVFEFYFQTAHVHTGGDLVLHEAVFDRATVVVIGDIFHEGMADALNDTALGLDSCQCGVDGDAAPISSTF